MSQQPGPQGVPHHLLLINVGNSRISAATFTDDERGNAERVATDSMDAVADMLQTLWEQLPEDGTHTVVIGSVAPDVLAKLKPALTDRGIGPLLVVGEDLDQPMIADVRSPEQVGTDRLCVAAAAYDRTKTACVVADLGTAATINLVADNGIFLGGAILPGLTMAAKALHQYTAALPAVEASAPSEVVGKDTASAIRAGVHGMLVGALREIVERIAGDIGRWPPLVLTGGDAEAVGAQCDFVDRIWPDLVLDGIALAYQLAMAKHRDDPA